MGHWHGRLLTVKQVTLCHCVIPAFPGVSEVAPDQAAAADLGTGPHVLLDMRFCLLLAPGPC